MAGLLEDFGRGLQGAGAILSDRVYDTQARERANELPNMMRALEIKKAQDTLQADQDFTKAIREASGGLQPSAMKDSGSMMDIINKVPMDLIARSPIAHQTMQMVGQQQAREAQAEARKEAINARYEQIEMQREAAAERAANTTLSIQERAAADRRHQELQAEAIKTRQIAAQQNIELRREIAQGNQALRRDALDAGGKPPAGYRKTADGNLEAIPGGPADTRAKDKQEKVVAPVQDLVADIDQAIKMIQDNPGVAGAHGIYARGKELVSTSLSGDTNTPANDFRSQVLQIQSKWKKLPTVAASRFKADVENIDKTIQGIGLVSNDAIAINNLTQLKNNLNRGIEAREGGPQSALPAGIPTGSKLIGKSPEGKDVYEDSSGKKWTP